MASRRSPIAATLAGVVAFLLIAGPAFPQDELVHRVKAAFIHKFALFTTWPKQAFDATGDRLIVGVVGQDALADSLDSIAGKSVNRRTVEIERLSAGSDLSGVHVLYVASSERSRLRSILNRVEGLPILTVGDGSEFVTAGGMIGLFVEGEGVRFEICAPCASGSGLKLSANLLQVARLRTPAGRD